MNEKVQAGTEPTSEVSVGRKMLTAAAMADKLALVLKLVKDNDGNFKYRKKASELVVNPKRPFIIDFNDIISYDKKLADIIVTNYDYQPMVRDAVLDIIKVEAPFFVKEIDKSLRIKIDNLPAEVKAYYEFAEGEIEDEWASQAEEYKNINVVRDAIKSTLNSDDKTRGKYTNVTKVGYKHLSANGSFYFDPWRKEGYWFDNKSKVLFRIDGEDFKAHVSNRLGINREDIAFRWLLSGIKDRVAEYAKRVEPKKLSYYDSNKGLLFYNHKPGKMFVLDGEEIRETDNGDGVLFLWDEYWSPVEPVFDSSCLLCDTLFGILLLDDGCEINSDEAKVLLEKSLEAILFRNEIPARPVLALIGEHGSGKTVFVRRIGLLLFGERFTVLGVEGQKQDGTIAYITNSVYGVFDNADENIPWLPDLIAKVATGMSIPRRRLYTTNECVNYPVDCLLAITARQTPWARADVIDRLLLFPVKRPERFIDEQQLYREVLDNRSRLIGELLLKANECVKMLKSNNNPDEDSCVRLSAFYNFSIKTSRPEKRELIKNAFAKMIGAQEALSFEQEETLITLLKKWIECKTVKGTQQTIEDSGIKWTDEKAPSEVYAELSKYAKENSFKFTVRNPLSLAHRLRALRNTLATSGIQFNKTRIGKGTKWQFSLTTTQNHVNKPTLPTQPTHERGSEGLVKDQSSPANPTPQLTQASQVKEVKDVKVPDIISTGTSFQDQINKAKHTLRDYIKRFPDPSIIQFAFLDLVLYFVREDVARNDDEAKQLVYKLSDEGVLKESETMRGWFTIRLGG